MMISDDNKKRERMTGAYTDNVKGLNDYAFYKTHNQALSEGLVQDTFVKTWRYLVKGGKIDLMKAFLYHVLNNLIIDEYRKRKTSSLDELREKGFEPSKDTSQNMFNFLDGKAAFLLMSSMSAKYKKVLEMKYIKDLSLEEISLIIGQSKNTIAVQIYRGLIFLKGLHASNKMETHPA